MSARWLPVTVRTSARHTGADPSVMLVTLVLYVIVTSALGTLWRAAADGRGGEIAGYSAAALTWYVIVSEAAIVSLDNRTIEYISDDITGGAVATELMRPAPVVGVRVAAALGKALPRLALCLGAGAVIGLVTVGAPPDALGLALAAPALVLAVAANLLAQHAIAAAAFWIRDVRSTWFLYQKLVFLLGGMLLPLEVLPDGVQHVATGLPFMAMAYVPARLASGHVQPELLAVQAGWILVLGVAAITVFAAGERRLQVVGG